MQLGNQLKKELNSANGVLLDLPVGNDLRSKLEHTRDDYEEILDQSLTLHKNKLSRYVCKNLLSVPVLSTETTF